VRTLVLSDLHLGGGRGRDVLRRPGPLAALCERLDGVDRLVLLGDVVELRHGPRHVALAAAEPVLRRIGDALAPGAEVVLVAGNHDHAMVAPWLAERAADAPPPPLRLDERPGPAASPLAGRLADWLGPRRTDVAYPGLWLRDDVYATHGHYLDRLTTLPTMERLASGAMGRIVGRVPETGATPDDFEAALGPMYAWIDNVANQPAGAGWGASRQNTSARAWMALAGDGYRPLRARALGALLPLGILTLNRLGLGPVRSELSGPELRRASLRAMSAAVRSLGVRAEHVVFGHTHRAGPLPGDDRTEWGGGPAPRLINAGCWVDEPLFSVGGPENPYWAGRGVLVEDAGPPRLERLVEALDAPAAD
jgi:predicted phosphodiesterase